MKLVILCAARLAEVFPVLQFVTGHQVDDVRHIARLNCLPEAVYGFHQLLSRLALTVKRAEIRFICFLFQILSGSTVLLQLILHQLVERLEMTAVSVEVIADFRMLLDIHAGSGSRVELFAVDEPALTVVPSIQVKQSLALDALPCGRVFTNRRNHTAFSRLAATAVSCLTFFMDSRCAVCIPVYFSSSWTTVFDGRSSWN